METIYDQIFAFVVTVFIGFLAGILFDIYRVIRRIWRPRKIGTFFGDLFFWILFTPLTFILLLVGNWAELRIYVFLGILMGGFLYLKYLSFKGQKIIYKVTIFLLRILKYIIIVITWPFKCILKIFLVPLGLVTTGVMGLRKFLKKGYHKFRKYLKEKVRQLTNKN